MKTTKFAFFAALALMMASCDKDDDATVDTTTPDTEENTDTEIVTNMSFVGSIDVTLMGTTTTVDDANFTVVLDTEAETADITMVEISFVTGMPAQTMDLVGVAYTEADGVISFSEDSIIPEVAGVPYSSFELTGFEASIEDGAFDVEFTCMSVYTVSYSGTIEE